ncbi:uncharacterized protein LY79DRAFT_577714 [Colletotrichum navitas]|uniref:Uncharacterized protein n=1 Tax=Colletotrichum navitas TaxID=681940 RepID=A0AAD8Q4L8_9PEZI|nr:uncharacterized protein LY79DRAFT_577714 [Colletotrichum navitas]KAK1595755.1 hypothetical protein LY79DRAFT_577714 [Colletotrichum navitas]
MHHHRCSHFELVGLVSNTVRTRHTSVTDGKYAYASFVMSLSTFLRSGTSPVRTSQDPNAELYGVDLRHAESSQQTIMRGNVRPSTVLNPGCPCVTSLVRAPVQIHFIVLSDSGCSADADHDGRCHSSCHLLESKGLGRSEQGWAELSAMPGA